MKSDELLDRIAATLRSDIGPAVAGEFERTQAFMGAVVVERIARGLRAAEADAHASANEIGDMFNDLAAMDINRSTAVWAAIADARDDAGLSSLMQALYDGREEIGDETFTATRARIRSTLRARIDRRVAVAR